MAKAKSQIAKTAPTQAKDETPTFFATPEKWRDWLDKHHAIATELWVGFHKKASGKKSITWPESVDEALSFGWIDAVRKSIDDTSYKIRFTRRKPTSIWSAVNVARVANLTKQGRMREAGLAAFAKRTEAKTGVYSFERTKEAELTEEMQMRFEKNKKAWSYFKSKPPWYQRTALHWVVSAKREETREQRFIQLVTDSANGLSIKPLRRPG